MAVRAKFKTGFTLIEMLVVIAIVAILAALISGAAVTMLESGRKAQAEMDISTMYKAINEYAFKYGMPPSSLTMDYETSAASTKTLNVLVKLRLLTFDQSRVKNQIFVDPWGHPYRVSSKNTKPGGTSTDIYKNIAGVKIADSSTTTAYYYLYSSGSDGTATDGSDGSNPDKWVYLKGGK